MNNEQFYNAQLENKEYIPQGDKPINNEEEVIKYLLTKFLTIDNDWVKEIIHYIFITNDDDIKRLNIDLFKKFFSIKSKEDLNNNHIYKRILKDNLEFQTGAIDLINQLALEYNQEILLSKSSNTINNDKNDKAKDDTPPKTTSKVIQNTEIKIKNHKFATNPDTFYCLIVKDVYVDKNFFVKEIIDTSNECIFTTSRRCGKTLNMNMLKTFLNR